MLSADAPPLESMAKALFPDPDIAQAELRLVSPFTCQFVYAPLHVNLPSAWANPEPDLLVPQLIAQPALRTR
jgi:hypothetical protein